MGKGSFGCGAMGPWGHGAMGPWGHGAMMTGKLKFSGPKGEAIGVLGPFDSFLQLTGKVLGDTSSWPK